jgi:hypothetical protein
MSARHAPVRSSYRHSKLRRQCEVRLLATSRPLPTVQSHPSFLDKPTLEVKASDEDLEKYIRSRASELHFRVMSKTDLLEDLVTSTVRATGGCMLNHFYDESEKEITDDLRTRFLLAQLLMDSFRDKLLYYSNVAPRNALLPSPIFGNAERSKNGRNATLPGTYTQLGRCVYV